MKEDVMGVDDPSNLFLGVTIAVGDLLTIRRRLSAVIQTPYQVQPIRQELPVSM